MAYSSTAILKKLIEEIAPDLRLRNAKTLSYLNAMGQCKTATHDQMYWDVVVSGSTVAGAAMNVAGTNQTVGDTVQATLQVGGFKFYHQFSVTRTDMVSARTAGVAQLKKLFKVHVDSGILELRRKVNAAIWTGDGTAASGGIIGMSTVLNPSVNYAGINSATYPLWNAPKDYTPITGITPVPPAPRALTRSVLYNLTRVQQEQEVYSDVYFVSPTLAQNYQTLFDTIAGMYSIAGVEGAGRNTDLGYNVMSYQGAPVLTDPQMPNGLFCGFRADALELMTYDLSNADDSELAGMGQKDNFETITSVDYDGLRINIALLPETNPGQVTFQMFVVPQLRVLNRRYVQAADALL